jgi:SAM-dependent methyltransferase
MTERMHVRYDSHEEFVEEFSSSYYLRWNQQRVEVIENHFGKEWFQGKRVLEVGCGVSGIGAHFTTLGADVLVADAVPEFVEAQKAKFDVSGVVVDFDDEWSLGRYDLVLHLGLLYHLADPVKALQDACRSASHLVLETHCVDDDREMVLFLDEYGFDQAWNKRGCRPSPRFVESRLKDLGMNFEVIRDGLRDNDNHSYDWEVGNTGRVLDERGRGLRRFWICQRRF